MEPSFFRKIRKAFAVLLAAVATGAAIPAYASAFTVTSVTSGQTTTFTVTRSGDTSVAETVAYRAVSRSALAELHFRETDALGIHNVFRYAFDKPAGAFENPPLLGIAFASDGTALVLTPPLVNTAGFDFSLLATDDLADTNPAAFPLDPSGTNAVPASSSSSRFFRLKAAEK